MLFYMCYRIQYFQKTPTLPKKKVINKINLGISNTEKYEEQNISHSSLYPERTHSQQFLCIVLGGKKKQLTYIHIYVYTSVGACVCMHNLFVSAINFK